MATFTATASGISAANTGTQNLTACKALAASMSPDDILEIDGFFPIASTSSPVVWPNDMTMRAATAGSTTQGFDVVGTASATGSERAMEFGPGSVIQGLTFTASEAPAYDPDFSNNNPQAPADFHNGAQIHIESYTLVEYCKFVGTLRFLIKIKLNSTNVRINACDISGAYYSVNFDKMSNSTIENSYFWDALVDNIKCNQNTGSISDNVLFRNLYISGGRDCIDLAGNWTNFTIEDSVFTGNRVSAIDSKTDVEWPGSINRYLTVNRVRFVNCRRAVATDYLDRAKTITLEDWLAGMPQDFTFTDCSFEVTAGTVEAHTNWLLKGGGRFRYVRPKYYGAVVQGFQPSNGFDFWPDGYVPTPYDGIGALEADEYDDDNANKQVFAARAAPTMDLEVGPAYFTGEATANVAPVLSGVAINPDGGPVGTVLGPVYTLNSDVFPAPTLTYTWKRGTTTIQTGSPNYTSQAADVGEDITLTMTASNIAGTSSPAASAAVAITSASAAPSITAGVVTLLADVPTPP